MKKKILCIVSLLICSSILFAQAPKANDIVGLWYSEKDADGLIPVVEIFEEDGKYYGYFFDYQGGYNGPEKKDEKNPNKELRDLSLKGLVYLMGLSFAKDDWRGGKIYNPYDGKTYNGKLSLEKNGQELLVRGSLDKAGLLGKTMRWTRVPDSEKSLYTPMQRSQLRRIDG